jgi:hypothetical protein
LGSADGLQILQWAKGDFGAASTTIADDDFGSFTTDSATPAPAAEPDNFFGEFGDDPPPATVPAPAAQSFAGPDDFDSFGDAQVTTLNCCFCWSSKPVQIAMR